MDHYPPSTPLLENCPSGSDSMQRLVRHLDLFSGIGGFALAAQMAGGIKTIGFSEIDPYANTILKRHWPDVPNYGDIRNVPAIRCDLITGGFPCQPWSAAGKRRGASDDRHLWPEMLRTIERCHPAWVLAENVPGIVGMALDDVLSDLEGADYEAGTLDIPALGVDARHIRHRIWIVAHSRRREQPQPMHAECVPAEWNGAKESANQTGRPSMYAGREAWPSDAGICLMADGIPARIHRVRGLGNAIVPQVAARILRAMMAVDCMSNK